MKKRTAAAAIALCLAAADEPGDAQVDPHRLHRAATPAPSGPARDGISGNSVARAGAHGIVGGPATGRPSAIGSVNLKQHH